MSGFDLFLTGLFGLIHLLDVILYPIYFLVQNPLKTIAKRNRRRATFQYISDHQVLNDPIKPDQAILDSIDMTPYQNLYLQVESMILKHPNKRALGTRRVLDEFKITKPDGVEQTKLNLADQYEWMTAQQLVDKVRVISRGLWAKTGLKPQDNIVYYAETSEEWFTSGLAAIRNRYVICTIYTNLGSKGVAFSIGQVDPAVIVTDQGLVPKLINLLKTFDNNVKQIIYFERPGAPSMDQMKDGPELVPLSRLHDDSANDDSAIDKMGARF